MSCENCPYAVELERFALGELRNCILALAASSLESRAYDVAYARVDRAINLIKENMAKQGRAEPEIGLEISNTNPVGENDVEGRSAGPRPEDRGTSPPTDPRAGDPTVVTAGETAPHSVLAIRQTRTPADYAIEHAGYLADAAKRLLHIINATDVARMEVDDADEDDEVRMGRALDSMEKLHEELCEAKEAVRTNVYEFEKRRDRIPVLSQFFDSGKVDFERYAQQIGCTDFEPDQDGNNGYRNPWTQARWDFWTASRDALKSKNAERNVP